MWHFRWLLLWCWLGSAAGTNIQAVTEELPPYNYRDRDGLVTGLSVDLLQRMVDRSKLSLDSKGVQLLPWARAYQMALHQPNTVIFSIVRLPEREDLFHWVGPIAPRTLWFYRLAKREEVTASHLSELAPWRIAVVRNSAAARELAEMGLNLVLVHDEDDKFRMMLRRRADIAPALQMGAAYHIESLGHSYSDFVPLFQYQDTKQFYFAFSLETDEAIIKALQGTLDSMRADGTYDEITQKWERRFWIRPASE
ncbi:transporter substrate-binding domain-containing protein [Aeromonas salmonicida]|uniref:substrate-binding periplasmic protein n=1 Tax=Aeromonas salmonicida TaxID=645 RepID=UPI0035BF815B